MDTPGGGMQKIIVKTPLTAEGKEDFTLETSFNVTVRQLKERLSQVLPKKTVSCFPRWAITLISLILIFLFSSLPFLSQTAEDQRLIFSGSLLPDDAFLRDCFRAVSVKKTRTAHWPVGSSPRFEPEPSRRSVKSIIQQSTAVSVGFNWAEPTKKPLLFHLINQSINQSINWPLSRYRFPLAPVRSSI